MSYNTYPGWHARGLARDLMGFHVRRIASAKARATEARAILEDMVRVLPDPESAYGRILSRESGRSAVSDSYVFHEHLEEENHPVYFHQFAERASRKGLSYLRQGAVARPLRRHLARGESGDRRHGRRTRWTASNISTSSATGRSGDPCSATTASRGRRLPPAEPVHAMHISTLARPVSEAPDVHSTEREEFRAADGIARLSTNQPFIKATLVVLFRFYPRALSFELLWDEVQSLLRQGPAPLAPDAGHDRDRLADLMLQCFGSNLVELHLHPPRIAAEPGERPLASPLARLQAESDARITNLCLRHVASERLRPPGAPPPRRRPRPRARSSKPCKRPIANDTFTIQRGDEPVHDPGQVRDVLGEGVEASLERMARLALFPRETEEKAR